MAIDVGSLVKYQGSTYVVNTMGYICGESYMGLRYPGYKYTSHYGVRLDEVTEIKPNEAEADNEGEGYDDQGDNKKKGEQYYLGVGT